MGPAIGWFGRAERLVGQAGEDSVSGYLLLPVAVQRLSSGDAEERTAASEAAEIAQRFGDHDLFATASYPAGAALIKQGRVDEGLQVLDEAIVAVTSGEVSPFLAGVVYCGVIASCEEAFEPRRACRSGPRRSRAGARCSRSWSPSPAAVSLTARGSSSCTGRGRMRSRKRCLPASDEAGDEQPATGQAYYQQAELHRLRGDYAAAEGAYRDASRYGREPQPEPGAPADGTRGRGNRRRRLRQALAGQPSPCSGRFSFPRTSRSPWRQAEVNDAASASAELDEIDVRYGR